MGEVLIYLLKKDRWASHLSSYTLYHSSQGADGSLQGIEDEEHLN
jgi:hypothetical protein